MTVGDAAERTAGATVADRFARDLADVLRPVAARLGTDLSGAVRPAAVGTGLLLGAGLMGVVAVGAASVTVLRLLEAGLPGPYPAGVLAGGALAAAGLLAVTGLRRLRPVLRCADDIRQVAAGVRAGLGNG